jgi:hypothetical protein
VQYRLLPIWGLSFASRRSKKDPGNEVVCRPPIKRLALFSIQQTALSKVFFLIFLLIRLGLGLGLGLELGLRLGLE